MDMIFLTALRLPSLRPSVVLAVWKLSTLQTQGIFNNISYVILAWLFQGVVKDKQKIDLSSLMLN